MSVELGKKVWADLANSKDPKDRKVVALLGEATKQGLGADIASVAAAFNSELAIKATLERLADVIGAKLREGKDFKKDAQELKDLIAGSNIPSDAPSEFSATDLGVGTYAGKEILQLQHEDMDTRAAAMAEQLRQDEARRKAEKLAQDYAKQGPGASARR